MKSIARICLLSLFVSGCSSALVSPPSGYANIEGGGFERRFATATGVVIGVRAEDNEVGGNVDFWADALDLRLTQEGYVREKSLAVKARSGESGRQLRYTVTQNHRPQRYWLTVFATTGKVYMVEAAGDKVAFDPQANVVSETVASFRIR